MGSVLAIPLTAALGGLTAPGSTGGCFGSNSPGKWEDRTVSKGFLGTLPLSSPVQIPGWHLSVFLTLLVGS